MKPEAYVWFCECGWYQEYTSEITVQKCPQCKSYHTVNSLCGAKEDMDRFVDKLKTGHAAEYLSAFKLYKR